MQKRWEVIRPCHWRFKLHTWRWKTCLETLLRHKHSWVFVLRRRELSCSTSLNLSEVFFFSSYETVFMTHPKFIQSDEIWGIYLTTMMNLCLVNVTHQRAKESWMLQTRLLLHEAVNSLFLSCCSCHEASGLCDARSSGLLTVCRRQTRRSSSPFKSGFFCELVLISHTVASQSCQILSASKENTTCMLYFDKSWTLSLFLFHSMRI